jgi:putative redox protein
MSVTTLRATLGTGYQTSMTTRTFSFTADEPLDLGGTDTAPTPVELLMGSLAACTAITLRMYAQRKEWPLEGVDVRVDYSSAPQPSMIKHLSIRGPLGEAQKARLLDIAERCPVARMLAGGVAMESRLTM